ncbi:uncharacterized protein [Bactrocera oleae]|uniref:uncharacterized protein n=1 Tax=Bactrocera oleae TaxID=104688 RepID=UPI00387E9CC0
MQLLPTQQSMQMTDSTPIRAAGSGMHQLAPLPLPSYVGKRLLEIKPGARNDLNGGDMQGRAGADIGDGDDDEPQQIQIEIPLAYVKKWNKSNKMTTAATTTTTTATAVNAATVNTTSTALTTITTTVTTPKGSEIHEHTHV